MDHDPTLPPEIVDAAREARLDVVAAYLDQNSAHLYARTEKSRETLLHLSAAYGHIDLVRSLLARGADVNAEAFYGDTPLWGALRGKHEQIVALLEQHGAVEWPGLGE